MPQMTFTVRWPDGSIQRYYSPSLVVHDHLRVGTEYTVTDFLDRTHTAMEIASDRVQARFGFRCTGSEETVEAVNGAAARYGADAVVRVVAMDPDRLPVADGRPTP